MGNGVWFGCDLPKLNALLKEKGLGVCGFKVCPERLKQKTQLVVVEQTIEVAADGFGQSLEDELFREDVRNHVLGLPELYLAYAGEKCVAFAAIKNLKVGETPVLYLSGLIVKKEYQGNGLMTALVTYEITKSRPEIVAARTQNPCILDLMKRVCRRDALYPYSGTPQGKCRLVTSFLAYEFLRMKNFDPNTLVDIATYGRCLYGGGAPRSIYRESNGFFEKINVFRGDSILFVGEVDHEG